jgi:hypothetical protein
MPKSPACSQAVTKNPRPDILEVPAWRRHSCLPRRHSCRRAPLRSLSFERLMNQHHPVPFIADQLEKNVATKPIPCILAEIVLEGTPWFVLPVLVLPESF